MAEMSDKMAAMRAAAEAKKAERETKAKEAEDSKSKEAAERAAKREAVTAERDRVTGEAAKTREELATMTAELGGDLDPAMVAEIQNDLAGLDAKAAELDAQIAAFESGSVQSATEAAATVETIASEAPKEAVHELTAETKTEAVEAQASPADKLKAGAKSFNAFLDKEFPGKAGGEVTAEKTKAAGEALKAERDKLMNTIGTEVSAVMSKLDSVPGDQARDTYQATIRALNRAAVKFGNREALSASVEEGGYSRFTPEESKEVLRMIQDLVRLEDRRRADSGGIYPEQPQDLTELYVLDQLAGGALQQMQKEDLQAIRDKVAKGFNEKNPNAAHEVARGPGASGYFARDGARTSDQFLKKFDEFILNKAA